MTVSVNPSLTIPDAELHWRFSPSGGPGGQHANRSNTRVELIWSPAESAVLSEWQRQRLVSRLGTPIVVSVDDHRSQARNRDEAKHRLAQRCRDALVQTKPRRSTKPSAGAKRRRLEHKSQRSETKQLRRRPRPED